MFSIRVYWSLSTRQFHILYWVVKNQDNVNPTWMSLRFQWYLGQCQFIWSGVEQQCEITFGVEKGLWIGDMPICPNTPQIRVSIDGNICYISEASRGGFDPKHCFHEEQMIYWDVSELVAVYVSPLYNGDRIWIQHPSGLTKSMLSCGSQLTFIWSTWQEMLSFICV